LIYVGRQTRFHVGRAAANSPAGPGSGIGLLILLTLSIGRMIDPSIEIPNLISLEVKLKKILGD
jgi:hypothetical protein